MDFILRRIWVDHELIIVCDHQCNKQNNWKGRFSTAKYTIWQKTTKNWRCCRNSCIVPSSPLAQLYSIHLHSRLLLFIRCNSIFPFTSTRTVFVCNWGIFNWMRFSSWVCAAARECGKYDEESKPERGRSDQLNEWNPFFGSTAFTRPVLISRLCLLVAINQCLYKWTRIVTELQWIVNYGPISFNYRLFNPTQSLILLLVAMKCLFPLICQDYNELSERNWTVRPGVSSWASSLAG